MKKKLLIVTGLGWLLCLLGGSAWSWAEQKFHWGVSESSRELKIVRNLYGAGLYEEAIAECERAGNDSRYQSLSQKLIYITWACRRQLGQSANAKVTEQSFLSRFSGSELSADMRFADAMDAMASGEYASADRILKELELEFPAANLHSRIVAVRSHLQKTDGATVPHASADARAVGRISVRAE
jgi:hypothetical protein